MLQHFVSSFKLMKCTQKLLGWFGKPAIRFLDNEAVIDTCNALTRLCIYPCTKRRMIVRGKPLARHEIPCLSLSIR